MSESAWLSAPACPLLRLDGDADAEALRRVQRLLATLFAHDIADALREIADGLRAEVVALLEAPDWLPLRQYVRAGARPPAPPRSLLGEVLDREAGTTRPPTPTTPAYAAACLSYTARANRVLFVARPREPFARADLEYVVAAGHYLGAAWERAAVLEAQRTALIRLEGLVAVGRQLAEQRETAPLLEHIARRAAELLSCERASLFLWDKARKELVGRPALGLPNNELRLPDNAGIVGRVLHSGRPCQVDTVGDEPGWDPQVDVKTGFRTRNLLCVPLNDPAGGRLGVLEVLNKATGRFEPDDAAALAALADHAVVALLNVREREALVRVNAVLEDSARLGARLVGASATMAALRDTVARVARTDLPVLVLGESGTGKEVVARAVHYGSPRHVAPFLPVNCAALAETLLESELFGHEKGAFTDARDARPGKFEAAQGGTLFLDEIGDMSAGGQAKLLRVLEERSVVRVGGARPIPVDARIVAATNRNLVDAVQSGKFRQDLYYRLSVVAVELPPLRARREDIVPLAEHFLALYGRDAGRPQLTLSEEAKSRLLAHDWPGNVRELRNLMERAAFLGRGAVVEESDLAFIARPRAPTDADPFAGLPLGEATDAFQIRHIQNTIARAGGNMTEAARLLGLHRTNLYRKMKLLKMDAP